MDSFEIGYFWLKNIPHTGAVLVEKSRVLFPIYQVVPKFSKILISSQLWVNFDGFWLVEFDKL